MKILLLGANGFVGSVVGAALQRKGHNVVRADIVDAGDLSCLVYDAEQPDFDSMFAGANFDVCVNCSGAASVPLSFETPYDDFALNTVRVAEILESLRQVSPATRFVHLSSAAVYGNPLRSPIAEADPLNPVSPYGFHKRLAEEICKEYSVLHGIGTLSVRIFSAYGPGLRKQIFWDVYQKALDGAPIDLFGTGDETRDFIFIDDLAESVSILIERAVFDGRAVNSASGQAVSIRTAVTTLLEALEWKREIRFSGTTRAGDPCHWQADVSYLKSIGFEPAFGLRDGLNEVAKWLKSDVLKWSN